MLQDGLLRRVAPVDGLALRPLIAHRVGVHLDDGIGDPHGLCRPRQVATVEAEADDDEVIRRAHSSRVPHVEFPPLQTPGDGQAQEGLDEARRDAEDEGRGHHGEHRDGEELLVAVSREDGVAAARFGQDEGKLADLAQGEPDEQGGAEGKTDDQGGRRRDGGLDEEDRGGHPRGLGGVRGKVVQIEEHADGDEEEAGEDIPEGQDAAEGLVTVLRLGDDEPGHERPQGEREPRRLGQPGHGEADHDDGQQEQFPAAGLGHLEQGPGDDPLRGHDDEDDDPELPGHEPQDGFRALPGRAPQQREDEHHGHDGEILEDEDAQGACTLGGVDLGAVLQELHDDGGTAQGGQEADEDRLPERPAEDFGRGGCGQDGQ